MSLPLTLPPLANLALYLLIVVGMIAVAVALDRWLAVVELRPAARQRHAPTPHPSASSGPATIPTITPPSLSRPVTAHRRRALPIPALLPCLAARERAAFWTIVGGALALRVLFPENFPDFLTGAELARAGEALRINAGTASGSASPGFAAILAVAWTLFGTTLPLERSLTALCVVAALVPFYALLRRIVGVVPALGATLLLGVSRPALLAGRGGEADPAILLLAPLTAWLLLRARERGDGRTWALCGVSAAALLFSGAIGWATLIALVIWLGVALRHDGATSAVNRRTAAGLLFGGGFALLIVLLATLAGGAELRAAIPFTLDNGSGAGPLATLGTRGRAFGGALFAVLTGGVLDPGAVAWRDPFSALFAVAGAILALRLGRKVALWWCLALIPPLLAGLFGDGDPHATIRILLLLPGYAFVALALDALLRRERLREPGTQFVAVGIVAALALLNVVGFALWSSAPATLAAQGPTIATRDFYLWRDYQASNLATGRGIVGPEEYATLAPAAIAEQIAARRLADDGGAQAGAAPRDDIGQGVATIGGGENGGHLDMPRALAIDRQGGYYIADTARGAIVHFGANGLYLGEWATAQIGQPWAVVATPDNTLLVLDADSGRIGRYDSQGGFLGLAFAPEGPTATRGLGLGLDGKVYVAQTAANRVLRLDPRPPGAAEPIGGGKQPATFNQPTAAQADARGNVVIYEPDGARLRGVGGTGQVRFNRAAPQSDTLNAGALASLPDGRIALVDARGNRVMLYSATGEFVGSFPVAGKPSGIAVTPLGLLAVTDLQERIVRLYALTTP